MSVQFYNLTVKAVKPATKESVIVTFEIPNALQSIFSYQQGQYITIKTTLQNEEIRRCYSICSAPFENTLSIGIKKVPHGVFSTYANETLKANDVLQVMAPTGNFYTELNSTHKKNYLAIACGSGITPIISIIKETLHKEPDSQFTLIYSNKNRAGIMFFEELEAIKNIYISRFNLLNILSRERTDLPLLYGRINEEKLNDLEKIVHYKKMDQIFICGPSDMIFSTKSYLENKGIPSKKIYFELFAGTTRPKNVNAELEDTLESPKSNISLKVDGRVIEFKMPFKKESILDSALQQGADLPFACKGGVCCTCKAKLIDGNVTMDVNYALEPDEVEQGYILTCQAKPVSDKVVIDFDIK